MGYNASQTKSPVCYDLRNTQWQALQGEFMFNFSTVGHRDKFLSEVQKRVDWLNDSMSRRFHVPCMFDDLAAIQLYMQLEGRGFFIFNIVTGEVYEKPSEVLLKLNVEQVN